MTSRLDSEPVSSVLVVSLRQPGKLDRIRIARKEKATAINLGFPLKIRSLEGWTEHVHQPNEDNLIPEIGGDPY